MNTQQVIFALLSALLPVLGLALPGFFKQDRLGNATNGIIATVVIIVFSALQAWSEGQIKLINPYLDFIIVLAGTTTLLNGPLQPVDAYLQSNIGPGAKQPNPVTPAQNQTIDLINSVIAVLSQHGQVLSSFLAAVQPTQTQAKPIIAPATAQPIHGPLNATNASTQQPSLDGVQSAIPAFADTATMAAVSNGDTGGPTSPLAVAGQTQAAV